MKIDLSQIDENQFHVNPHLIAGETCYLIVPKEMGCTWTQENKIFRSSVWNADGHPVSFSFPKFVNIGEKPEVFPVPTSLKNATVVEKLDGSLITVTRYKGEFIIRTRGTVSASKMEKNGHEIELFRKEYLPKLIDLNKNSGDTWDVSYIFEWESLLNVIVIRPKTDVEFTLIGAINHEDYSLFSQSEVDELAGVCGFNRPMTYTFTTIDDLISSVQLWEGKEGVCIYCKGDQEIFKCKSFQYLKLHRFKSSANYESTVDLFFEFGMPSYQDFQEKLVSHFDYECAQMVLGFTSIICDGYKEVLKIVNSMKSFIEPLKGLPRKVSAEKIIGSYSTTNRAGYCFKLLDGKELDRESLKKLLYQVTKNS